MCNAIEAKKTSPLPRKTNMKYGTQKWRLGRLEDDIPFQLGWFLRFHVNFPACNLKDSKARVIFKNNCSFCMSLCPKRPCEIKSYDIRSFHHVIINTQSPAPARGSREGSPISAKRAKVMTKTFHKAALTSKRAPFGYKHLSTKGDVYYSP